MTDPTKFTVLMSEDNDADWPDRETRTVSRVTGALADRLRAKTGLSGDVEVEEEGMEGGYSEYTVEWEYEVTVRIGGAVVWRTTSGVAISPDDAAYPTSSFGELMGWLAE